MTSGGSRKLHSKSRLGCKPCKKRRIKCDGRGPSCANCERRKVVCEYADLTPPPPSTISSLVQTITPLSTGMSDLSIISPVLKPSSTKPLHARELELLHYWSTTTSLTLAVDRGPETAHIWQAVVPQLAQTNPFLLHSVLGLSAAHVASQHHDPATSAVYRSVAHQHHGQAAVGFLRASAAPASAVLPFSTLTMLTMLALLPVSSSRAADLDNFIQWLLFLRRSVAFIKSHANPGEAANAHETAGLVAHLHRPERLPRALLDPETLDLALVASLNRLSSLIGTSHTASNDADTLRLAIKQTKLWFRLVPPRPKSITYIVLWVSTMSDDFFALLSRHIPIALALLAHWVVPLYHAPQRWFMSDWPRRVTMAIFEELKAAGILDSVAWVFREMDILESQI
ncbi:hypothetical protein NA57DRAFT_52324 [Rhizodiscina lignyota]|uniref:Zn(2)-C6 fungal-type domain-containing protein n=1 Tax=Rhizodiscina lignyota TaxID=1504668 RepID=A0A9P4IJJ0_9PEZI|nr:hypothetical protein NA57DRAFT_52324 [Rhizodiscina lignyota]